jgi:hypothetical protein
MLKRKAGVSPCNAEKRLIQIEVIRGHSFGCEALLKELPANTAAQLVQKPQAERLAKNCRSFEQRHRRQPVVAGERHVARPPTGRRPRCHLVRVPDRSVASLSARGVIRPLSADSVRAGIP